LNRIIEVNEEIGYAVVEPGVSLRQLYTFLRERDLPWWMDCTDATPDTSVLGNVVDRGMGFSAYGDRFANSCALEVLLADGTVVETGFSHFLGTRMRHTHKWGVGPSIDGVFTQSNCGIVLRITVWLMPRPEAFLACFAVTPREHFEELIDQVRKLRMANVLPSNVHIVPARWESPRAPEGSWYTIASFGGPRVVVDAYREAVKNTLGRFSALFFGDPRDPQEDMAKDDAFMASLGVATSAPTPDDLALRAKVAQSMLNFGRIQCGIPMSDDAQLITVHPQIEDPALPARGHYTYGPTSPATGAQAAELLALLSRVYAKYGIRYTGSSIAFINPRSLVFVAHVVFDRHEPGSPERAKQCVDELIATAMAAGFPPYRVGIQSMNVLDPSGSGYWRAVRAIKRALDPHDLISPGRYLPGEPS